MIEIERMYSCEGSVWHGHLHSENSKCFQQISVNSGQKEFMWPKCGKIRNNEGFSLIAKILRNVIKIAKFQMIFNICFCCFRVPFFHTFYFTNSTSEHHSACHQIVGDNWWSWIVECRTLSRWISWICEIEHSCVISSGFSILKMWNEFECLITQCKCIGCTLWIFHHRYFVQNRFESFIPMEIAMKDQMCIALSKMSFHMY